MKGIRGVKHRVTGLHPITAALSKLRIPDGTYGAMDRF